MPDRFNILSLSGGGYLGLYTVSVLAALEERFGAPIGRHFDLIAGTSVGGIIALGLAAEIPAAKIKEAFEHNGTAIFSDRPAVTKTRENLWQLIRFAKRPKFQGDALRRTVIDIVGQETQIGHLKRRVIIPTVNLTKGAPQLFKTPHHPNFRTDYRRKVVDVALATSAAPTYFPIAEIEDSLYADGGLYANSPDLLALHEAEHFLAAPIAAIHMLSIGTTTAKFSFAHAHGRQLGWLGWMQDQRLVSVILASQQQLVDYMMGHRLADRYLRLDADQSKEQERHLALDVATPEAQKTIRGLAAATVQQNANAPRLEAFFGFPAPEPVFHYRLD